jgi:CheY-like chemotaxis protein
LLKRGISYELSLPTTRRTLRLRFDPKHFEPMAKFLIVDNNRDAGEMLADFFRRAGHQVNYAPGGREALIQILTDVPDAVLLDLLMPEMDGPSFLEVVRSYLRIQSLPVVVLTALADSPMIDRAVALKVNSVLVRGKASSEDILKAMEEAVVRLPG